MFPIKRSVSNNKGKVSFTKISLSLRDNVNLKLMITLTVLFLAIFILFLIKPQRSFAAPQATGIDEIVVVGTDGFIYAYDFTGQEIYKSPEGGWNLVTTADLNNDGDHEIIAVSNSTIKVYDPQIIGTAYNFSTTYTADSGQFTQVQAGNLLRSDSNPEIALLRSVPSDSQEPGRIVIYDPLNTSPVTIARFGTNWDDFALGDYDGDDDDDFALIDWNPSFQSGFKNFFELRDGANPTRKLDDNADGAGQYSDSEWLDVATGHFFATNGDKEEWVGTRRNSDKNIITQRFSNKDITDIKYRDDYYEFLAVADFRNENLDQIAMLRNTSDSNQISMRFLVVEQTDSTDPNRLPQWASLKGLGTGWLNLAAGNLDDDETYREAAILRANLIRVYRVAQAGSEFMDCQPSTECLEISGSFKGSFAVGDLGIAFSQVPPFAASPSNINHSVFVQQTVPSAEIDITGEKSAGVPIKWWAIALPRTDTAKFQEALEFDPKLDYSITDAGLRYQYKGKNITVPSVPWISLSAYTGTTPAKVTVAFSNTVSGSGSFLAERGTYRAFIQVWQNDASNVPIDQLVKFVEVSVTVGEVNYLPIAEK